MQPILGLFADFGILTFPVGNTGTQMRLDNPQTQSIYLHGTACQQLVDNDAGFVPGPLTLTVRATGRCGDRIRNCASASLGDENARDCDDVNFVERRTREP